MNFLGIRLQCHILCQKNKRHNKHWKVDDVRTATVNTNDRQQSLADTAKTLTSKHARLIGTAINIEFSGQRIGTNSDREHVHVETCGASLTPEEVPRCP